VLNLYPRHQNSAYLLPYTVVCRLRDLYWKGSWLPRWLRYRSSTTLNLNLCDVEMKHAQNQHLSSFTIQVTRSALSISKLVSSSIFGNEGVHNIRYT